MSSTAFEFERGCPRKPEAGASRLVGDPVDLVTGAVVDEETDFRLPRAAFPLAWLRRFDSRELICDRGLGLGFRHDFDHELYFDLDGITYVDSEWRSTSFPFLTRDAERSIVGTLTLERVTARIFIVHVQSKRRFQFEFESPQQPARLSRVIEGDQALSLAYERVAKGQQLVAIGLGMLGRLRIDWAQGHIARIALHENEPERETELVRYHYDDYGCLLEVHNAYKHAQRYNFDDRQRLVQKFDRRGYKYCFEYDAADRCIASRGEDGAQGIQLEYRPIERTTFVTRHDGGRWQYQYNEAGTVTNILDAHGGMQAYVTDGLGRISEEVDPLGNVTTVYYDLLGESVVKLDPLGHWLLHDDSPHPLEHRIAETPLAYEFGALFQPPERLPSRDIPLWAFPPHARAALQVADPEWGGQTRVEENLQGLPLRELRKDGKARRWAFDENANVRWQIDFDGRKRAYEYTSDNHLAREVDPAGRATNYEHSATEQLTAFTDAGGTRSTYIRDLKDRVIEVHRHNKVRERYVYDYADNLIEKHDCNGELMLQLTIGHGNLPVACKVGSAEIHTFSYDDKGRLNEACGAAGKCTFSYAGSGERLSDLRDGHGVVHTLSNSGSWSTTVLGRFVTHYKQSRRGELVITDPTGYIHRIMEISPGIIQREFSNGVREVAQYDLDGRCLLKALDRGPADQPWVRSFHYSGEGDLLEQRDNRNGNTRYDYDTSHRLQRVVHPDARVDSYEYDAADNLLMLPSAGPEGATQLEISSGNRLGRANAEQFFYDERDHIARRHLVYGTVHYLRDALDQLIDIKAPDYQFSARYDPLGRRTEKVVNGATTHYYWDTDRLVAEVYPGGSVRLYVYAGPKALVPTMFVQYASVDDAPESGRRFYVIGNHLGAVELVLNDRGAPAWQAHLDPYGLARIQVGHHFPQPLRFPGHFYDAETGLHYNRFRYYDPKLGRYLESDPLGIEGGANLYAYTSNPLKEVDVRGEVAKCPNGLACKAKALVRQLGRKLTEGTNPVSSLLWKLTRRPRPETVIAKNGERIDTRSTKRAVVPTAKVNKYMRGKVAGAGDDIKGQIRKLNQLKQKNRKEFDRDPQNQKDLQALQKKQHNVERSEDMAKKLDEAGIKDTPAENERIQNHLLQQGEKASAEDPEVSSVIKGPDGDVKVVSTWTTLPDERSYLSTVKVIPISGS